MDDGGTSTGWRVATGMMRLPPAELIHLEAHGQDHHPYEEGAHERHTDGRRPHRPEA